MTRFPALIFAAFIAAGAGTAVAASVAPATPPQHLRGTLQSVSTSSVTLQTAAGATQTIALTKDTSYSLVTKSTVNDILPNSYIGTAAKGTGPNMVALEVVIFPAALRGAGEGHYPWDSLPDVTKPGSASPTSMNNGSVASVTPTKLAASSMTNGNVQTVSTLPGAKQISVVYKGGKQIILVLPNTPVVATKTAGAAVLKPGVHVVIFATGAAGKFTALHIIAGADGLTPPM